MKKNYMILIIMTLVLFSAFQVFSANVELVTNTGFESGTTGWAARSCTFNVISGLSYSGTYCGQATGRSATWQGLKQSLLGKVTNGATYTVSGWVRISASSDSIKMSVEQADGNGTQYIGIAEGTGNNTGWVQLAGTITVSVTGTLSTFDLYFEGPAAGVDIYVDDASFYGPGVSSDATGTVDTATRYQVMDGFGAAGGWYETTFINHPSAATLYDLCFNQLGLDLYRFRNTYQIDSGYLDRQKTLITNAKAVRPQLKLKVAAWSPPASMKSNSSTVQGTLAKNSDGTYMYDQFGQWWADSLSYMSTLGINPDYVSVQNEPDYTNAGWDTCEWAPTETTDLAGFDQGFRAVYNRISSTYKLVPTDGANFQNAGPYLDAFTATDKTHIYAYAHHLYAGLSNIVTFATTYNDKPRWMTEYSNYASSTASTFDDAMNMALTMDTALVQESVSAYFYWELFWGGTSGLVSIESSTYTIRPVYYGFKQFSAFVDEGWQRVDISSDSLNLNLEAYINPDNTQMSVIIINASTSNMTLTLSSLNGFAPSSGTIYRTSATENCANVGSFSMSSAISVPARSISTISMIGNGATVGPTAVVTAVPTVGPTDPPPTAGPTNAPGDCTGIPVWSATTIYADAGTVVQYNCKLYMNNWYSSGQNPEEYSGAYSVWTYIGDCNDCGGTAAPTDIPSTPVPTDVPTTPAPTDIPTDVPATPVPTDAPTDAPATPVPTDAPTTVPVATDTPAPTAIPTATPVGVTAEPTTPGVTADPTTPPVVTADPTTPPSETPMPDGCTCTNLCSSTTAITVPFTKDGSGEYCYTATSIGTYVNSWNTDVVNVNATNCTNTYVSSSSIAAIGGVYYIYFKGSYSWSHLEIK